MDRCNPHWLLLSFTNSQSCSKQKINTTIVKVTIISLNTSEDEENNKNLIIRPFHTTCHNYTTKYPVIVTKMNDNQSTNTIYSAHYTNHNDCLH